MSASLRERALDLLKSNPGEPYRTSRICAELGVPTTSGSSTLSKLADNGLINRDRIGVYSYPPTKTSAPGRNRRNARRNGRKPIAAAASAKRIQVKQPKDSGLRFDLVSKLNDTELLVRSADTNDDYFVLRAVNI